MERLGYGAGIPLGWLHGTRHPTALPKDLCVDGPISNVVVVGGVARGVLRVRWLVVVVVDSSTGMASRTLTEIHCIEGCSYIQYLFATDEWLSRPLSHVTTPR